jgi:hypothetical protein
MDDIASLEQHLRGLEERFLRPDVGSSRAHLEKLLAEDFLEIGSSGVAYDRESIVSMHVLKPPAGWSIVDFKAKPLADGVALVTYVATKSGGGGTSFRCSIWRRDAGRWRMVFHQGTRVER